MRKETKAMFLSAAIGLSALISGAAESAVPALPQVDFDEFRAAAFVPAKAANVKNGRLIYEVRCKNAPNSFLLLRGSDDNKLRVDIITADDIYTACRNGDAFWGYCKESGQVQLTAEDIEEMKIDTPFFPFPFQKNNYYAPFTPAGAGVFRTNSCHYFETKPLNNADLKLTLWVDDETGKVCLISSESADGFYQTSFRNYRDFDGVELATRLNLSSPDDVAIMNLISAEWNVTFAPGIFDKGGELEKDPRLAELQRQLSSADAIKAQAQREQAAAEREQLDRAAEAAAKRAAAREDAREAKRITGLQKELQSLDLQIAEKTKRMEALEAYITETFKGALDTAKAYAAQPFVYRHSWSYYGWGRWGNTKVRKNREARRVAKALYNEGTDATKEYDALVKELTSLQLQRTEVQSQLDKTLKEQAKKDQAAGKTK